MSTWLPRGHAQWQAAIAGILAWLAFAWLAPQSPRQAMLSYLFAFIFFTGLSVGALALIMVHVLTGGGWGEALRRQWLAAARTLPLQLLFVVPILVQTSLLYSWNHPDLLVRDAQLRAQGWYLNTPFFVARTLSYFLVWLILLALLVHGMRRRQALLPRVASVGLIVFALSMLLASTDWVMSLLPHWHSSIFGMMVSTGCMLAAAALGVLHLTISPDGRSSSPRLLGDLGSLLFTLVLAWWYLAFMQYLTIWVADLPGETVWYIPRTLTTWRALAWLGVALTFVVPFIVLLIRRAKRHRGWLAAMAAVLLLGNLADALWLVIPTFRPGGFDLRWTDLLAPVGMGALWLCVYLGQYRAQQLPSPLARSALESAHG